MNMLSKEGIRGIQETVRMCLDLLDQVINVSTTNKPADSLVSDIALYLAEESCPGTALFCGGRQYKLYFQPLAEWPENTGPVMVACVLLTFQGDQPASTK